MAGDDPEAEAIINQLKRVQDAIGEWHDWITLGITALKILPTESSPLISAIRTNTRSKFLNALRIADEAKRNLLTAGPARTASRSKRPAANERETASAAATA
jgi:CHAD domain-containing protein